MNLQIVDPKTGKTYGLGHQAPTGPALELLHKGVAKREASSSSDLTGFEDPIFDQGPVGSCEGHSHAAGISIRLKVLGRWLGWIPSPDLIYRLALSLQRQGRDELLRDIGTESRWCRLALSDYGVVPMGALAVDPGEKLSRFSDCTAASAKTETNLHGVRKAAKAIVPGAYSCADSDDAVKALSNGIPVEWGGWVDTAFMLATGNDVFDHVDLTDPDKGGHSMLIVAHRRVANGTDFLLRNSWGKWAKQGHLWVTERFVNSGDELTALEVN